MGTTKGKVRVRGTCKSGHTTEATSAPGRLTWEGTCGHDGCDLVVKARRVPADTPKPPPETKPAAASDEDRFAVKEVTSYGADDDDRRRRPDKKPAAEEPRKGADVPKPRPAPAGPDEPAAPVGGPDPAEPARPAGKLTFRDRVAERRARKSQPRRGDFLEGIIR